MPRKNVKNKTLRKSKGTRERLLEVAIQEFSEHGYHGVAVDDIVRQAGCNKRMVYHYFGSKKALYRAALLDVYARGDEFDLAALRGRTPEEKLRKVLKASFKFHTENPEFVKLLLWENLSQGKAIKGEERLLQKNPFLERLSEIVQEGIEQGRFRADYDMRHLLIQIIALSFIYYSNTYTLSQALEMDLTSPRVLKRAEKQAIDLFFNGLLIRPADPA